MRVTQKGGTIELTGNFSNKEVVKYLDMSAEEMSKLGFEIIGRKTISSEGYLTTNGVQIKSETLETLILRKR